MSEGVEFKTTQSVAIKRWSTGAAHDEHDLVIVEVPIALVYNGISHVVLMCTPSNIEALAIGFSISERIVDHMGEIYGIDIHETAHGIEVLIELASEKAALLREKRRNMTGRTGCGLCGVESLEAAVPTPVRTERTFDVTDAAIQHAQEALSAYQPLQLETGAVHCAAWCSADGEVLRALEDVGRHNALDKLIGWLHVEQRDTGSGFVLMSSRASYEIVAKANSCAIHTVVCVSAPTSLAVEFACSANIALIGFARPGKHIRYSGTNEVD